MLLFFPSTAFVATRALPPRRVQPRRVQPLLLEEPEVPPIVDPIIDGTHSERDNGEPSTVTTESGERSDRHGAKEIVKGALQAVKEDTKSAAKVVKEKLAALTGTGTAALSGASPSSSPVAAAPAADSAAGEEDDLTKEREDAVGDRLNKLSDAPISTETYLNSLSRFADDGRRLLNAPQRYSSKDWFANLRSMPRCQLLRAVRGQLAAARGAERDARAAVQRGRGLQHGEREQREAARLRLERVERAERVRDLRLLGVALEPQQAPLARDPAADLAGHVHISRERVATTARRNANESRLDSDFRQVFGIFGASS